MFSCRHITISSTSSKPQTLNPQDYSGHTFDISNTVKKENIGLEDGEIAPKEPPTGSKGWIFIGPKEEQIQVVQEGSRHFRAIELVRNRLGYQKVVKAYNRDGEVWYDLDLLLLWIYEAPPFAPGPRVLWSNFAIS